MLLHEHVYGNIPVITTDDGSWSGLLELVLAAAVYVHTWTGGMVALGVLAAHFVPVLLGARGRNAGRCYAIAVAITLVVVISVYLGVEAASDHAMSLTIEKDAVSPPR